MEIVRAILGYLSACRVFAWRQNTGGARFPTADGRVRLVRFGRRGMPDIAGVLPGGRALFIEVKRPGQRLSPHQLVMLRLLGLHGALALTATSVEDVARQLAPFLP